MTYYCSCWWK